MKRLCRLAAIAATACRPPESAPEQPSPDAVPAPVQSPAGGNTPRKAREVPKDFSGDEAFKRVEALLELPRVLGDPRRGDSIDALEQMLGQLGAPEVQRIDHEGADPRTGQRFAMTTLLAHLRPDATRRFVLATHFDIRPWADEDPDPKNQHRPVTGANDGTSGLAVLFELVGHLERDLPKDVGLTIALFDGEELGRPEAAAASYCAGSREVAAQVREGKHPLLARAEFGIVLDMVADPDLMLTLEVNSVRGNPELVEEVWGKAAELGFGEHFVPHTRPVGIIDDHKFLTQAGIPSILLIDKDYEPWHTVEDTIDKISARSMEIIGRVVLAAILERYRE